MLDALKEPVRPDQPRTPFHGDAAPTARGRRFSGRAGRVGERPLDARGDAKPAITQPDG
jgi:hypothetical protein